MRRVVFALSISLMACQPLLDGQSPLSFVLEASPTWTAGEPQSLTLSVLDVSGHIDANFVGAVHFSSSDANATLPSDFTFTASDAGAHSFPSGARLLRAGTQTIGVTGTTALNTLFNTSFTVLPNRVSALQVTGLAAQAVAGQNTSVHVALIDAFGNTVTTAADTVQFTSSDPRATLPANTALVNGQQDFPEVFLITAGVQTLSVAATNAKLQTTVVSQIAAGPLNPQKSTWGARNNDILANGNDTAVMTLTACDAFGNPLEHQAVQFTVTGGNVILTPTSGITDANGLLTATLQTTRIGTEVVSANLASVALDANVRATWPTFAAPVTYGGSTGDKYVAAGDFNQDGNTDFAVVTMNANTIAVFFGRGDGTVTSSNTYTTTSTPRHVVAGDIDGDGYVDIVYASNAGVNVLFNQGDGTFDTAHGAQVYSTGTSAPFDLGLADVNNDKRLDVLAVGMVNTVGVFINGGGRTIPTMAHYSIDAGAGNATFSPQTMATGDINGDGFIDWVTVWHDGAFVLLNQKDGTFSNPSEYPVATEGRTVQLGDIDGDGQLDLVTADNNSSVYVLYNLGGGAFGHIATIPVTAGSWPDAVGLSDVDGNGTLDIVATEWNVNQLQVLLNQGSGNFAGTASFNTGGENWGVLTPDLNGDDRPDLVVPRNDAPLNIFINTSPK